MAVWKGHTMPRTMELTHYPIEVYGRLFKMVVKGGAPVMLPPLVGISAMSLRGKLYAFRRAASRNKEEARARGLDPDFMAEVNISINAEGNLVLQHKTDTQEAKALLAALEIMGAATLESEADAMLKRLLGGGNVAS